LGNQVSLERLTYKAVGGGRVAMIRKLLPTHLSLPDTDGAIVENFQEHPQGTLLTESLLPVLRSRHPDGQFCIGYDSGIYWRVTDPPLDGCKAPDWFYVPDVPPLLDGEIRRSYVLWEEWMPPLAIMEFVSGDGSEERDTTPWQGKFWVYERVLRPAVYGIFDPFRRTLEVYHLIDNRFQPIPANERGHFFLTSLQVELGIWDGEFQGMNGPWLRVWDAGGQLLLHHEGRIELERQAKEMAERRAEEERKRAERYAEQLRALGVDPDKV
jgi:Uma2 family endonuclease